MRSVGSVVWITGLPGTGKTVLADAVAAHLRATGAAVVRIDGDRFRAWMDNDLGYSTPERLQNAWRIARFCNGLAEQQLTVVCSTVSLYREIHDWNRSHSTGYREIYLRAAVATRTGRKESTAVGVAAADGSLEVVGLTQSYDEPTAPDLVIDTDSARHTTECAVRNIVSLIR
ncbi:MAG: adenylyl-sulfate kinase [Pseudomonadota bacterium]